MLSEMSDKDSFQSETPLLDHNEVAQLKKYRNLRQWIHWIFHIISIIAIFGLLVGLEPRIFPTREKCWTMFNYYCKAVLRFFGSDDLGLLNSRAMSALQLL